MCIRDRLSNILIDLQTNHAFLSDSRIGPSISRPADEVPMLDISFKHLFIFTVINM